MTLQSNHGPSFARLLNETTRKFAAGPHKGVKISADVQIVTTGRYAKCCPPLTQNATLHYTQSHSILLP